MGHLFPRENFSHFTVILKCHRLFGTGFGLFFNLHQSTNVFDYGWLEFCCCYTLQPNYFSASPLTFCPSIVISGPVTIWILSQERTVSAYTSCAYPCLLVVTVKIATLGERPELNSTAWKLKGCWATALRMKAQKCVRKHERKPVFS